MLNSLTNAFFGYKTHQFDNIQYVCKYDTKHSNTSNDRSCIIGTFTSQGTTREYTLKYEADDAIVTDSQNKRVYKCKTFDWDYKTMFKICARELFPDCIFVGHEREGHGGETSRGTTYENNNEICVSTRNFNLTLYGSVYKSRAALALAIIAGLGLYLNTQSSL